MEIIPGLGSGFRDGFVILLRILIVIVAGLILVALVFTRTPIDLNWIMITGFVVVSALLYIGVDVLREIRDELRKQNK